MILNKTKFSTPAVILKGAHIDVPFRSKPGSKYPKTYKNVRVDFDSSSEEHQKFLDSLSKLEKSHNSTHSNIKPRRVAKFGGEGVPTTYEDHQTDKAIEFKTNEKNDIDVVELLGENFVETNNTNITYGSEVIVEGTVEAWTMTDKETGKVIQGIKLNPTKVRILRRGKAEQTVGSTN